VLQVLAIAGGGALGALARFWLSAEVYRLLGRGFPWGTLVVNVLGSFLIGVLFVLFLERSTAGPEVRSAVLVGFLGAFTTFSTFSLETLNLIEAGQLARAFLNMVGSVAACLAACWLGLALGRSL
jgi:fluoride exporter